MECWIQCWAPQCKRDTSLPKQAGYRPTKVLKGWEHLRCSERLREMDLFSLEKRRLRASCQHV